MARQTRQQPLQSSSWSRLLRSSPAGELRRARGTRPGVPWSSSSSQRAHEARRRADPANPAAGTAGSPALAGLSCRTEQHRPEGGMISAYQGRAAAGKHKLNTSPLILRCWNLNPSFTTSGSKSASAGLQSYGKDVWCCEKPPWLQGPRLN